RSTGAQRPAHRGRGGIPPARSISVNISSGEHRMRVLLKGILSLWLAVCFAAGSVYPASALAQTQVLPDFTRLVEEQGNAVVNIITTQAARRAGAVPQVPGSDDDEIEEFFRRF